MRLKPEQIVCLAQLSGEWIDVPDEARKTWFSKQLLDQPELAPALRAMTAEFFSGKTNRPDPLSLPSLDVGTSADESANSTNDLIGPYRLLSLLGRGGMGAVWLAEQVDGRVQRKVALKLLLPGLPQAGWHMRFERERDILAAMEHPGIARLIDAGSTPDGQPYLAMAYVQGQGICSYAEQHQLDVRARVRLVIELLAVVQYAHSLLVIHRDLKPANILVDQSGRVVLLDFGIAKVLMSDDEVQTDSDLTAVSGIALTLYYASPEQVGGRVMGVGTDVYSVGVVLYELLAGQRPYLLQRSTRAAMEEAILDQEVAAPSDRIDSVHAHALGCSPGKLARQLRGDLDAIVLKALQKDPTQRYATADAFAQDLQHWMEGRPVLAQGLSRWYVARRALVRHRWSVATATLIFTSLAIGLGVAMWQAKEAREETAAALASEAFLVNLFREDVRLPRNALTARQAPARALLQHAASQIPTALQGAPRARLHLLGLLSQLHQELSMRDSAYALKRQQFALALVAGGLTPEQHAQLLLDLAMSGAALRPAEENRRLIAQAEQLMDDAVDLHSRLRGYLFLAKAVNLVTDHSASATFAGEAVQILRVYPPSAELAEAMFVETLGRCASDTVDERAIRLADNTLNVAQRVPKLGNMHMFFGVQALCLAKFGRTSDQVNRATRALASIESELPIKSIGLEQNASIVATLTELLQDFAEQGFHTNSPAEQKGPDHCNYRHHRSGTCIRAPH